MPPLKPDWLLALMSDAFDTCAKFTPPLIPNWAFAIIGNEHRIRNKIDYGFAFGGEVHPFKGLLVGARYNLSLGKLYKDLASLQAPSFTSEDAKNNVFTVYAGWKFGGFKSPKQ